MASSCPKTLLPTIKLISLNIWGLNIPEKRTQLLSSMHKNKADIFLQETHFKTNFIPKPTNSRYPTSFHATNPSSKSKGVSILFANNCPFQISDTCRDPEGRYLFLKGSLHGKPITLANIYVPNKLHSLNQPYKHYPIFKKAFWFWEAILMSPSIPSRILPLVPHHSHTRFYARLKLNSKIYRSMIRGVRYILQWKIIHFTLPHTNVTLDLIMFLFLKET